VRDLNKELRKAGFKSGEIHGDMDQSSRIAELDLFKAGDVNILVASDVAARGLDIKGVSHVFNYDTPWHPDDYVHRIGRTGRAGAKGRAITLVTPEDREALENVEKLTGIKVPPFDWSATGAQRDEGRQPGVKEAEAEARASAKPDDSARSEDNSQDRKPRSRRRKPDAPKAETAPQQDDAAEDETVREEAREEKPQAEKPARKPRKAEPKPDDSDGDKGEWNGPMPSFLGLSAL